MLETVPRGEEKVSVIFFAEILPRPAKGEGLRFLLRRQVGDDWAARVQRLRAHAKPAVCDASAGLPAGSSLSRGVMEPQESEVADSRAVEFSK